jgi:hypothetical protein
MTMVTDSSVIERYPEEMKTKGIIRQSVQNATNLLRLEILRCGGIVPPIIVEWSIAKKDKSNPLYSLNLLDYADEPNPVERSFGNDYLASKQEQLGVDLSRMLRELLSRRACRQAGAINDAIRGGIRADTRGL